MSEFNNRIAAQRKILQLINKHLFLKEELFGLSRKAIDRWSFANNIDSSTRLVGIINEVSEKLFFLANKSQEQVTEEYAMISTEIEELYNLLELEIS